MKGKLPFWTWILPFFLCHLGTQVSLHTQIIPGTSLWYFPTAIGLVLIHWWGPRILLGMYVNAVLCAGLWKLTKVEFFPLYAAPEVFEVLLSYLLVRRFKIRVWSPSLSHFLRFLLLGLIAPITLETLYLEGQLWALGDINTEDFFRGCLVNWHSEMMGAIAVTIPALVLLSQPLERKGWSALIHTDKSSIIDKLRESKFAPLQLIATILLLLLMTLVMPVERFWFVYGFVSIGASILLGFLPTLLVTTWIIICTLFLPTWFSQLRPDLDGNHVLELQISVGTLCVSALIVGRSVTSLLDRLRTSRRARIGLRKTKQQLAIANSVLESRVAERTAALVASNKELEAFAYSLSHDLRAPLRAIAGFSNILSVDLSPKLNPSEKNLFDRILTATLKMDRITESMLQLSRISQAELKRVECNLTDLADSIVRDLTADLEPERVKCTIESGMKVDCDPGMMQIALENLFANAIKFSARKDCAEIQFSSKSIGEETIYTLSDNGVGFDPKFASKLFKPFSKLHDGIDFEGTGIGLATVARIISKHRGRIEIQSSQDEGTIVSFTLEKKVDQ